MNVQKIELLKADSIIFDGQNNGSSSRNKKSQQSNNGPEWLRNPFRPKNKLDSLKGT